jgi:hypothetical protein
MVVRRFPRANRDPGCQIMYVGGSPGQSVRDALAIVKGAPVLTVTDGGDAAGVIEFAIDKGRVRFRVDDESAADNGLTINSRLLGLAISVRHRARKP